MTNTGRVPDTDEAATAEATDALTTSGRTRSLAASVFGRSLWLGVVVGAATGPVVAYAALLLSSLGNLGAGDWFFGLAVLLPFVLVLAVVGAGVGLFVGAGSAAAVLLALWLESRSVWRVGAGVRVASVAVGSLAGGAFVVPVAAAFFPLGAFAVPPVVVGSALIASFVALRQGKALDTIRLRSAPFAARTSDVGMPRERVFRIAGAIIGALLLIALIELAAALRRVNWYSTCGERSDGYLSRVDFGSWPPQLTCVFADGSIEAVPRAVFVVACALALLAAGLLAAGVAGSIRTALRGGQLLAPLLLVGSIGMALLALGLAYVTAVGAFGPAVGLRQGDPRSAPAYNAPEPYVPDEDSLGDGSSAADAPDEAFTPPPPIGPIEVPSPSTTYSIDELTTELQALVDATFAAAGPIVDPAIPAETQTFAVSAGECYVGEHTGQTARLEVGFDTADVEASLDRVRALWAADGYELYERTTNAKGEVLDPSIAVNASGADPQPATTLGIRIYDGFLILNVEGLCVSR